ncbi:hypothetical protein Ddc_23629 [Ditylenchus destructor]|nr:hypothetical protein Ddc_23629 [Ditylenchus destructor]
MDPFVYIRLLKLIPQNDVLNLLIGATDPDRSRLQYKKLKFNLSGDVPKFINWMKNHIFCDEILIEGDIALNHDEELLDLLTTGAHCTSAINMGDYDSAKVIVDFVQKFMHLKSSDEWQLVESLFKERPITEKS